MTSGIQHNREHADSGGSTDLAGFHVQATDGSIGKVVYAGSETALGAYLVVATGPWHFGKDVVLPDTAVSQVDHRTRTVFLGCTKAEVKDAPEAEHVKPLRPSGDFARAEVYYGKLYSNGKV